MLNNFILYHDKTQLMKNGRGIPPVAKTITALSSTSRSLHLYHARNAVR